MADNVCGQWLVVLTGRRLNDVYAGERSAANEQAADPVSLPLGDNKTALSPHLTSFHHFLGHVRGKNVFSELLLAGVGI
jgi:hypothetical protein